MLKVGLTGGIGCGKSTVGTLFRKLDAPVIDADEIAHQLVEPGKAALAEIHEQFGDAVFNTDGTLDRRRLGDIVFAEPERKQALEAILHPKVYAEIKSQVEQLNKPYCILSIPLLFETNRKGFVDRILVVDCPVTMQLERVTRRSQLTEAKVQAIIDNQVSREYRIANADDIIDNTGNIDKLSEQVERLHNFYTSLHKTPYNS